MEVSKTLKEINNDDLKTMFNSTIVSFIERQSDVKEKLTEYLNYDPPCLGDIIEYLNEKYAVTCVYTDNSVDICGKDSTKKNVGLYKKDIKVVGRLQLIKED